MLDYFSHLKESAAKSNHRYGLVLHGDLGWTANTVEMIKSLYCYSDTVQLGGEVRDAGVRYVNFKQGKTLLGQECNLLICYLSEGFDANSFCAASGSVKGGGLVIILPSFNTISPCGQCWLETAFSRLIQVEQSKPLTKHPNVSESTGVPFTEQSLAVKKIHKVLTGHRKRPLVMTADRGRGKSSALGLAAAELMNQRSIRICITAPSLATVTPVFEHAQIHVKNCIIKKGRVSNSNASLEFIAPDELLRGQPDCDLLLVDEASAIPVPMLQKMVEFYNRAVFSTTIHGYEGCGRGFTIKFENWLRKTRPGTAFFHLNQPIRWAENDPLENWLFETFLLDTDLKTLVALEQVEVRLEKVSKQQLVNQPHILRELFALLVNAHYQTTPNDLMLLLEEEEIDLYAVVSSDTYVGCIMTINEGGLEESLIKSIQRGQRRPKGHLVPVTLANHLGISQAACQRSTRIMRIAIHPDIQRTGIGTEILSQFLQSSDVDFVSTSFGATAELIRFWAKSGFSPVKMGTQRDQASGCHSIIMVKGKVDWLESARELNHQSICYLLTTQFSDIAIDIVRILFVMSNASVGNHESKTLIMNYCLGGASYESIAPLLFNWMLSSSDIVRESSDLLVRKVLQQRSWEMCGKEFSILGRKRLEQQLKADIQFLLESIKL
ncbi:tRNA(Met) cytidine acetyltransferase TmcA [Vibrio hepatarius]|uniref:tRNA(Met) cytidine acetyltransferase TmcA n=1 Tax=Vibrio hepatarius TaxID=171383 RepID=UPI001C0962B1|nr:GNAT family N-acetyltransferase [Vibrio hepatarius]MBU2899278.1 GNAT family N-acetyltransferase [Vibrio hepatarius]